MQKLKLQVFFVLAFLLLTLLLSVYADPDYKYKVNGARNPFVPLLTSEGRLIQLEKRESRGEIKIEGIIFDNFGVSYAIVDGQVVKVGDSVGDKQVLKIEKNKVYFVKQGQVSEVELKKEE